jgi:hypothetical protein
MFPKDRNTGHMHVIAAGLHLAAFEGEYPAASASRSFVRPSDLDGP